jgi:hypothetical protein
MAIDLTTLPRGSTRSKASDGDAIGHAIVLEDSGALIAMPGTVPLQIIRVGATTYTHVGEDADGRWTYRPL